MQKTGGIRILYEDNHLLALEKPQHMLTQADITGDEDLLSCAKRYLKERYAKKGDAFLAMVHRLDRPVGGAIVFAKTSKAASRLSDAIRRRQFWKTYLAVVHGIPEPLSGTMKHFLYKNRDSNIVKVAEPFSEKVKEAVLNYSTVDSTGALSLIKVELVTGRPHQIRVQFSAEGYPIYGDVKYGAKETRSSGAIALWSYELRFKHPVRDETMSFVSYPPGAHPWDKFSPIET